MRRTETGGPLELLVVDVDGDDDRCTCELRTGNGCVADAATTEDGDAVAAADAAAAEQAGGGQIRDVRRRRSRRSRRRSSAKTAASIDLGPVLLVDAAGSTSGWRCGYRSRSELSDRFEDHVGGGLDLAHTLADSFDDATGLVAEQERPSLMPPWRDDAPALDGTVWVGMMMFSMVTGASCSMAMTPFTVSRHPERWCSRTDG